MAQAVLGVNLCKKKINESFVSIFISSLTQQHLPEDKDWNHYFEPYQVYDILKNLPGQKVSADFPFTIYRVAAYVIAEPLCHQFNISIDEEHVPSSWKEAKIIPLPKCTNPGFNDLRLISLLPTPLKILEYLLLANLSDKLLSCYGKEQFGFRPGSSTALALISLHDKISYYLEKNVRCQSMQDVETMFCDGYCCWNIHQTLSNSICPQLFSHFRLQD